MTTLHVVSGRVRVMTHETTIMALTPMVDGDGPNPYRLHNKLNTHVALYYGPIKFNFRGQTVLN